MDHNGSRDFKILDPLYMQDQPINHRDYIKWKLRWMVGKYYVQIFTDFHIMSNIRLLTYTLFNLIM